MKSIDSLKSYKGPGEKRLLKISHALDRYVPPSASTSTITQPSRVDLTPARPVTQSEPLPSRFNVLQMNQVNNIISPSNSSINVSLDSVFNPGSFSNCQNCSFTFNICASEKRVNEVPVKRRRLRFIASSSEDENSQEN